MALINRSGEGYIKVVPELCVFTLSSVEIFFMRFENIEERSQYKNREGGIQKFTQALGNKIQELLNSEENDEMRHSLETARSVLSSKWDKYDVADSMKDFIELLKPLGFKDEWLTPLRPVVLSSVSVGGYTNQNFTHKSLYDALKKFFKNDYIDC